MHTRATYRAGCFLLCFLLAVATGGCCGRRGGEGDGAVRGTITVFNAAGLTTVFLQVKERFEKRRPGVHVRLEPGGSIVAVRKLVDMGRPCDVLAVADYRLVERFVMPVHASWNMVFAADEVVLAYTAKSRYTAEISPRNWHRVIVRPEVTLARVDENRGPIGYRTLLCLKIAEACMGAEGLYRTVLQKIPPARCVDHVSKLVPLLERGQVDYAFMYRSTCEENRFKSVRLAPEVNLGDMEKESFYGRFSVEIAAPGGGKHAVRGAPVAFSLTIPRESPNRKAAVLFVHFMFTECRDIWRRSGFRLISPPRMGGTEVPAVLRALCAGAGPGGKSAGEPGTR